MALDLKCSEEPGEPEREKWGAWWHGGGLLVGCLEDF